MSSLLSGFRAFIGHARQPGPQPQSSTPDPVHASDDGSPNSKAVSCGAQSEGLENSLDEANMVPAEGYLQIEKGVQLHVREDDAGDTPGRGGDEGARDVVGEVVDGREGQSEIPRSDQLLLGKVSGKKSGDESVGKVDSDDQLAELAEPCQKDVEGMGCSDILDDAPGHVEISKNGAGAGAGAGDADGNGSEDGEDLPGGPGPGEIANIERTMSASRTRGESPARKRSSVGSEEQDNDGKDEASDERQVSEPVGTGEQGNAFSDAEESQELSGDEGFPEQVSEIFTEIVHSEHGRRGRKARRKPQPMHFYIGMTRLEKQNLARTIIVNGGRVVKDQGGENDNPPIYPLLDGDCFADPAGRTAYSDRYIAECITAGKALDITYFRLGRRAPRLMKGRDGKATTPPIGQENPATNGPSLKTADPQHSSRDKLGEARQNSPTSSGDDLDEAENKRLFDFACEHIYSYGGYSSRFMWGLAADNEVLGRPASMTYLRRRYMQFDPKGARLARFMSTGEVPRDFGASYRTKDTHQARSRTIRASYVDDEESSEDGDAKDAHARKYFESRTAQAARKLRRPIAKDRNQGGSGYRVVKLSLDARSREHRGRRFGKEPSAQLRAVVRKLSNRHRVSEKRAFRALKSSDGDVHRANSQLSAASHAS